MYTRRGLGATSDITSLISQIASAKGVSPALALAVAQHESGFNPNAQNPSSSAAGLFQLINAAQQTYGVTNPYDPTQNATAGVTYLQQMLQKYNGNQDLALMAYATGPTATDKWIAAGSDPATVPAEASQFISWVDSATGTPSLLAAGGGTTLAAGSGSDSSGSGLDLSSLDLSSLVSVDPTLIAVGIGIIVLVLVLNLRN